MRLADLSVAFFGYHNAGVKCLAHLLECGGQVLFVVTHDPYPRERVRYDSVKSFAGEHGLCCYEMEKLSRDEVARLVRDARPDVLFSIAFRRLIPEEILGLPPKGSINMHDSLLPRYRGFTPSTWTIINGEKETGVTMHYMEAEADRGDIISQLRVPIDNFDTGHSLQIKLAAASLQLFRFTLPLIVNDLVRPKPQDESQATYYGRRGRSELDDLIAWEWPAQKIYNLVRAITYPVAGAFTYYKGMRLFVWRCEVEDRFTEGWRHLTPGTVVAVNDTSMTVRSGDGLVRITSLQLGGDDYGPVAPRAIGLRVGEVLVGRRSG